MSKFILLTLLIASRCAAEISSLPSFDEFVSQYGFDWTPESEVYNQRKDLFTKELQRVQQHNDAKLGWTETINKFSAMTEQEKKSYRGRSESVNRAYVTKHSHAVPEFLSSPISLLPKSVDWRQKLVVSAVKDQGSCGSCWAFASTATIESHVAIATGKLFDLSVNQLAFCAPNPQNCGGTGGCRGSTGELAMDYITTAGFYQEFQQGYAEAAYKGVNQGCTTPAGKPVVSIKGYVELPSNNYTALMNAVANVGPVAVAVDAAKWSPYAGGIYSAPLSSSPDIDHLVVVVGYGEDATTGQLYWLVRNSWNPNWGENGYIRLLRSPDDESNCAMDATPQDGVTCDGQTAPVKVCGTSGILYDSVYPVGAGLY